MFEVCWHANDLETKKREHNNNEAKCEEAGYKFLPLAVETFGGWGNSGRETLRQLARKLSINKNIPMSKVVPRIYTTLSVILQKENIFAILNREPKSKIPLFDH